MAAKPKPRSSRKESPDGQQLLVLELQEIHNAETQLSKVLPRLMKAVQLESLREQLETRQQQGERLISDIESALEEMDESPGRKKNLAAEGLINDAREHVQELEAGPALDAVLIAAIQKTEHYCIAAWGTSRSLAAATGQKAVVKAMERALKEGKALDEELTRLAEEEITPQILGGSASGTDEDEDEDEGEEGAAEAQDEDDADEDDDADEEEDDEEEDDDDEDEEEEDDEDDDDEGDDDEDEEDEEEESSSKKRKSR